MLVNREYAMEGLRKQIPKVVVEALFVQVVSLHGEIMDSFNSPNTLCM